MIKNGMNILAFDSSEDIATVSLFSNKRCASYKETDGRKKHAAVLLPMIDDCLKDSSIKLADIDLIYVGTGPGSFTGVRVGVSSAKGLKMGAGINTVGFTYGTLILAAFIEQYNLEDLNSEFLIAQSSGRKEFFCIFCKFSGGKIKISSIKVLKMEDVLAKFGADIQIISDQKTAKSILKDSSDSEIKVFSVAPHCKYLSNIDKSIFMSPEEWITIDLSARYYRPAQADEEINICK